jgi:magnesium chelatase family protein
MLAKLHTFSLLGIEAVPVEVEVDVSPCAAPKTILVGLPEAAVRESTHRVARAVVNSGFVRPQDRVVINLAPAELPKQAASFDLPITLGILAASGQFESNRFDCYAAAGELSLEGRTRPARGAFRTFCLFSRSGSLPRPCHNVGSPCVFWNSHATVLGMASETTGAAPRTPQWVTRTPPTGHPCRGLALQPSTAGD